MSATLSRSLKSLRRVSYLGQVIINRHCIINVRSKANLHNKMVKEVHVHGFDAFKEAVSRYEGQTIISLFSGSLNKDGISWCPDCVDAEPVIKECLKEAPEDSIFIHCSVGDRDFWKDKKNVFRTDASLKLRSVPTLMKLGTPQKLEEAQCKDSGMVKMLLCDED